MRIGLADTGGWCETLPKNVAQSHAMAQDPNHGRRVAMRVGLAAFCVAMAVLKAVDPRFTLGGDRYRTPVSASLFWVALGALILLTGHADAQLQPCQVCRGAIRMAHAHRPAGPSTEPTER